MKIANSIFFLIYAFLLTPCFAQREANVWIFDHGGGIDFNHNRFTPFNVPGMEQAGGSASICDKETGQLLFYTDGRNVWNRNFQIMPNGTGLRGGYVTAQAALILPYPGKDHLYYLFTTKSYHDTIPHHETDSEFTGLYYSVVDMQLDGGFGDVVQERKNNPLMELSTNKLTAVPHANGKDYWLITHEWGSNRFVVFPVTEDGISLPEFFSFGTIHTGPMSDESAGWLLPSPNGKMLACAVYGFPKPLELYDFDANTGTISNLRELGMYPGLYGVSFSPDNSKLYFTISIYDPNDPSRTGGSLYQADLSAGSTEAIIETTTELYFIHETGAGGYDTLSGSCLQLAPDGRLYVGMTATYLDVEKELEMKRIFYIDKPNLPAWQSDPSHRDFVNIRNVIGHSYPNFFQSYFNNLEPVDNFFNENECGKVEFKLFPNPTENTIKLRFGDTYKNCIFPLKINIYSSIGQTLRTLEIFDGPLPDIDVSSFPSSMYLLSIASPFRTMTFKIIKK